MVRPRWLGAGWAAGEFHHCGEPFCCLVRVGSGGSLCCPADSQACLGVTCGETDNESGAHTCGCGGHGGGAGGGGGGEPEADPVSAATGDGHLLDHCCGLAWLRGYR